MRHRAAEKRVVTSFRFQSDREHKIVPIIIHDGT